MRTTGTYVLSSTLGESVRAFVPHPLPPSAPDLAPESFVAANHGAELALARLSGVAGLVPSVDWLLYGAIRREAMLTSQIEGTQTSLTDLFDEEVGFAVSNTDDVREVTNYLRAFRLVRENLRDPGGLPISVRPLCDAHRLLLEGARGSGQQPGELRRSRNWIGDTRPGNAVFVPPPAERVADPARQPEDVGDPADEGPEAHALHAASDYDTVCCYPAHDVTMDGIRCVPVARRRPCAPRSTTRCGRRPRRTPCKAQPESAACRVSRRCGIGPG
jgi:hypothetical protein